MTRNSLDIKTTDPLIFDPDMGEVKPSSYREFRINCLTELDWKIDAQKVKLDKFNFLSEKASNFEEDIMEIRSDPQGDGVTRAERHDIHELQDLLGRTEDRIDSMPDQDAIIDRLLRLEMNFIHKSAEWDLSI